MPTKKAFGFGCEDAQLFQPGSPPTYTDLPGIQEADFTAEVDETQVQGDDDNLTTWYHSPKATITLKASVLDLDVIEEITGNPVSAEDGGYSVPLLTDNDLNPPERGLRIKIKGRSYVDSAPQEIYLYIYRVIFAPAKYSGIKGGEAFNVEIKGEAYKSLKNETGVDLTVPARGRMLIKEV